MPYSWVLLFELLPSLEIVAQNNIRLLIQCDLQDINVVAEVKNIINVPVNLLRNCMEASTMTH